MRPGVMGCRPGAEPWRWAATVTSTVAPTAATTTRPARWPSAGWPTTAVPTAAGVGGGAGDVSRTRTRQPGEGDGALPIMVRTAGVMTMVTEAPELTAIVPKLASRRGPTDPCGRTVQPVALGAVRVAAVVTGGATRSRSLQPAGASGALDRSCSVIPPANLSRPAPSAPRSQRRDIATSPVAAAMISQQGRPGSVPPRAERGQAGSPARAVADGSVERALVS